MGRSLKQLSAGEQQGHTCTGHTLIHTFRSPHRVPAPGLVLGSTPKPLWGLEVSCVLIGYRRTPPVLGCARLAISYLTSLLSLCLLWAPRPGDVMIETEAPRLRRGIRPSGGGVPSTIATFDRDEYRTLWRDSGLPQGKTTSPVGGDVGGDAVLGWSVPPPSSEEQSSLAGPPPPELSHSFCHVTSVLDPPKLLVPLINEKC